MNGKASEKLSVNMWISAGLPLFFPPSKLPYFLYRQSRLLTGQFLLGDQHCFSTYEINGIFLLGETTAETLEIRSCSNVFLGLRYTNRKL